MLYKTNNSHGGDIYGENVILDYSASINPFGAPQSVKKAICDAIGKIDCYPDPYCRELVEKIAEAENIPKDYILCGNGAAELIYSYFEAVLPQKVLETAPTFSGYSEAIQNTDCRIVRYGLSKSNNFDLNGRILDFLSQEKPDVLVICNPNNPTGMIIPMSLLKKILDCCCQNNIRLFVDECFLDLTTEGVSMKGYLKKYPNLFILKAFTKSYGMAGVRLGYCMSADSDLIEKMSLRVQPWNVSTVAQKAGISALSENDFVEKSREYIEYERKWLSCKLEELGFWVCPSYANYLLFHGKDDLDIKLKKKGIMIRNCGNYHGLGKDWFRIAVRLHNENEKLISAIKSVYEG